MDFSFMWKILPRVVQAAQNTLIIAILSLVISLAIAIIVALVIHSKVPILSQFFKVYVSFFRGTPALLQLYLIYFGLANTNIPIISSINAFSAVVLALSLNMSAYMAETIRGALSSVDNGQTEAGFSIGLTKLQVFTHVVFPQAFRVAIPSLGNNFVDLIKGSSIAFTIGVGEIMATANLEGISAYKFLEAFTVAAIVYWVITIILNFLQRRLENRLGHAY